MENFALTQNNRAVLLRTFTPFGQLGNVRRVSRGARF